MMPHSPEFRQLPIAIMRLADPLLDEFEAQLQADHHPRIEEFVARLDRIPREFIPAVLRELLNIELHYSASAGPPTPVDKVKELVAGLEVDPEWIHDLERDLEVATNQHQNTLDQHEQSTDASQEHKNDSIPSQSHPQPSPTDPTVYGDFSKDHSVEITKVHDDPRRPSPKKQKDRKSKKKKHPVRLGRYRILSVLGNGNFGTVYLASDDSLGRKVAIKVPNRDRKLSRKEMAAYEAEAKIVAQLDHPHVVPVYDVGQDQDLCFVVSKYIEGRNLAELIREKPSYSESCQILIQIAEALYHAHSNNIVHRDVKPANILIDSENRAFLADFGVAIREEDFGKGSKFAGTPAYMSPEQARGEGHRVDGRSDVFSLGIVMYELITERRPYRSKTVSELLDEIAHCAVRPPREIRKKIPSELEQICLKAMAHRISDRYTTAIDFAADLREFEENSHHALHFESTAKPTGLASSTGSHPSGDSAASTGPAPSTGPSAKDDLADSTFHHDSTNEEMNGGNCSTRAKGQSTTDRDSVGSIKPCAVQPKGLKFFDENDRGFFLDLLPGLRSKGLPQSIVFWKKVVEQTGLDAERVCVLYGPSGCGKSSFVRAGLIPVLQDFVSTITVTASAEETDIDIRLKLQVQFPQLPKESSLSESLTLIRRGDGFPDGRKLLIVIDQFEQWLHANGHLEQAELIDALRQCDGDRIQCLLLIRVDFLMGIHRFMRQLDIPIRQDSNSATLDLFDESHAKKVLTEFGRAYGRVSESCTAQQQEFVASAVKELAGESHQIIPVHLALFVEIVKGRDWTLNTMEDLGGIQGIGLKFLQDTFDSVSAPLEYQPHSNAFESVLEVLLPPGGTAIRSVQKSRAELLHATNYEHRPDEFETVMKILIQDLRLVTLIEATSRNSSGSQLEKVDTALCQYELTHDYLVPSIREWVDLKHGNTLKGRVERRLSDLSMIWNLSPTAKNLPGLREYLMIQFMTKRSAWTVPQRRMMKTAGKNIGIRAVLASIIFLVVFALGMRWRTDADSKRIESNLVFEQFTVSPVESLPKLIPKLHTTELQLLPRLRTLSESPVASTTAKRNARLGILQITPDKANIQELAIDICATSKAREINAYSQLFAADRKSAEVEFSRILLAEESSGESRLRAACLLARLSPDNASLKEPAIQTELSRTICKLVPSEFRAWISNVASLGKSLVGGAILIYESSDDPNEQLNAATILVRHAHQTTQAWIKLLSLSKTRNQFDLFFRKIETDENAVSELQSELERLLDNIRSKTQLTQTELEKINSLRGQFTGLVKAVNQSANAPSSTLSDLIADRDQTNADAVELIEKTKHIQNQIEEFTLKAARVAIALLRLDARDDVLPLLKCSTDERLRTELIHQMAEFRVEPQLLVAELSRRKIASDEETCGILQALLLSLGEYGRHLDSYKQKILVDARDLFINHSDRGVHAAARWLLLQLSTRADLAKLENDLKKLPQSSRNWVVTSQGHTLVELDPREKTYLVGSPLSEEHRERGLSTLDDDTETRHSIGMNRKFAISSTEVTVEQYLRFDPAMLYATDVSPHRNSPINYTNYIDAARYCNWLSEQEGLPKDEFCFEFQEIGWSKKTTRLVLPNNFLQRRGYRLPTEAEWEIACRAGTTTARYFAESDRWLFKYARFSKDHTKRDKSLKSSLVGLHKPNSYGLFDVYGNVSEWCIDSANYYVERSTNEVTIDDERLRRTLLVNPEKLHALRGGGLDSSSPRLRSAARDSSRPVFSYYATGFRVAKTIETNDDETEILEFDSRIH